MKLLWSVGAVVALIAFLLRLYGLGAILTVDEPQWVFRADRFMDAFALGDPGATFQGTHPGVVPMLLIGSGIRVREFLTGEELVSPTIGSFRTAAKLPIALAMAVGIGCAAAFGVRLWGKAAGLGVGGALALDPLLVGHAQLAHVDALLAVLMVLTLLAALMYARTRETRLLFLSGALGGLALLTKLPAVFLGPLVLATLWRQARSQGIGLQRVVRDGARWLAAAGAVFFLLWPSMWLNVLPNARYLGRDIRTARSASPVGETAELGGRAMAFYPRAALTRATPALLALAVGGVAVMARRRGSARRDALLLAGAAVGFLVFLSLVDKRADRYILPALAYMDVLAGIGWGALMTVPHGLGRRLRLLPRALAVLLPVGLTLQILLLAPYAIAYRSSLSVREELTQSGWGEGMEEAAAMLNAHPLATELRVASWYAPVFREFFHGTTMTLSSRDDARVTHVVLYRNMRGRPADDRATGILDEFSGRTPVATVHVLGREVAWIYATDSSVLFTEHAGELVGAAAAAGPGTAVEVGQFIPVPSDGLGGIRLVFATFSSRPTTADLVLHVREQPDGSDLRTVSIPAATLEDGQWREIRFAPIEHSAGKTYYLSVTSPNGAPGNAVTVRFRSADLRPGSMVLLRRPLGEGERREALQRRGDLAYDLLY